MNALSFCCAKSSKIFLGILFLAFCFGCQKDFMETEGVIEPVSLKSAAVESQGINNLMVITKAETLPAGFEGELSAYGEVVNSIPEIGVVVIKPAALNSAARIARLRDVQAVIPDLNVRWIDPDELAYDANQFSIGDNETFFGYQWGMDAIDAPEAWDAGYTGQGARVFILDSGIDANNPDLSPNLNKGLSKSFVDGENYYVRDGRFSHHGTHVAGIIAAADNNWGVIGVAPNAEIVAVKVVSEYTGSGYFSWIFQGIIYAANNEPDVINMSLGALFNRNGNYLDDDNVWQQAPANAVQYLIVVGQRTVNYAVKKGAVVIAAAGNDGMNSDGNGSLFTLPADLENVIAVSATAPYGWIQDQDGSLDIPASYTNYGVSLVDLAAPGGDFDFPVIDPVYGSLYRYDMVLSTGAGPQPGTNSWSFYWMAGTSMASPHVAGVAALVIGKNGGEMKPVDVMQQLFKTADKIDKNGISDYYGNGRVNAFRAVTE